MRTQVGIVGAGPSGLLLSHLLHLQGIESVIVESRSREYVESRIRAGVLEQSTVDLLNESGAGERMQREGLVHRGVSIRFDGRSHRIDFAELTGGRVITVYGQHEIVKDLIAIRLGSGGTIHFGASGVEISDIYGPLPQIRFLGASGEEHLIRCDFIAGCDGYHGICRPSIPADALNVYERDFPMAWLGILAESPPISEELIYAYHERGFALFSMRSPRISRLYLQCAPDEDLAEWPDERIWDELEVRLRGDDGGLQLVRGPILQKGVTSMRSFVVEPMQYGHLFLAGDAAHIMPPTGAKGMNLAVADVAVLARSFGAYFRSGATRELDQYSQTCLRRVWAAQRFSSWMTSALHRLDEHTAFERKLQTAELAHLTTRRSAAQSFAENYVGLPFA